MVENLHKLDPRRSYGVRASVLRSDAAASTRHRRRRGEYGRRRRKRRAGARKNQSKSERLGKNHLRILCWNCRSARQRGPVLEKLIYDNDVIALQETRLNTEEVLKVSGFQSYYNSKHMGQAILVRYGIKSSVVDTSVWNNDNIQVQAVNIDGSKPFTLVNIYACNNKVDQEKWRVLGEICDQLNTNIIMCGDFNARGQLWGNTMVNKQGEALEEALTDIDLICLNDGRPTRLPDREGDTDSALDLTLVSPSMSALCQWGVLGHHGSDHLPCSILVKKTTRTRFLKQDASFRYGVHQTDVIGRLRNRVRKTPGRKKDVYQQPPWWTPEVAEAWTEKRSATKEWEKCRKSPRLSDAHKQAIKERKDYITEHFKRTAREAKHTKWETFCNQIGCEKSLKKFWRLHRSMNGGKQSYNMPELKMDSGEILRSDEDKGEALMNRFLLQTEKTDRDDRKQMKQTVHDMHIAEMDGEEDTVYISVAQISSILKTCPDTAPGPDGIRYCDLKCLEETDTMELSKTFNKSIKSGIVPDDWLHSYLRPVPKPGKDHEKVNGYRIITLQNTVGKLMEKIVARNLTQQLESSGLLAPTLGGYRPGRDTWCNAAVFAYDTYEGFQAGMETAAAAIDLEDAYNRVPYNILIRLMMDMHIETKWVNWIAAALFERTVSMRCGTWASKPQRVLMGLPQGSPLSPVLFNVYTSLITSSQRVGLGRTMSFADDILVYRQGNNRDEIATALQQELDRLSEWCEESSAHVNPAKATLTWFSLNTHIGNTPTPVVDMCSIEIDRTNTMRYLGITFDRGLSYKNHVDSVIVRARKGLTALKAMAYADIEQRLLFLLYQGLVLSVIDYGLGLLTVSRTQLERLDRLQNEAMRLILGCTKDTSCHAMRYALGLPTMATRHKVAQVKAYMRISADINHPLHNAITDTKGMRLKRGASWMAEAENLIRQVCDLDEISHGKEWTNTPVDMQDLSKVIITLGRHCRSQIPATVDAEIRALIDQHSRPEDVVIYTDGSVKRGSRSAWAYTAQRMGKTIKEDSGAYNTTTSSLTMEMTAASRALAWVAEQVTTHTVIISDSMNMLQKIAKGNLRSEWVESIRKSQLTSITWIYTPGHAGVHGNERADQLASRAPMQIGRSMDRADIINSVRTRLEDNVESLTLTRLRDGGVKLGEACLCRLRGKDRRHYNQILMGTISRDTLEWLLHRRTEHAWVCPMCKDVDCDNIT